MHIPKGLRLVDVSGTPLAGITNMVILRESPTLQSNSTAPRLCLFSGIAHENRCTKVSVHIRPPIRHTTLAVELEAWRRHVVCSS